MARAKYVILINETVWSKKKVTSLLIQLYSFVILEFAVTISVVDVW